VRQQFASALRGFSFIVLASTTAGLSGCAGFGKTIEPPRAHIANISVQEMRGLETVFQVELRVMNTNDVPLTVKGMDCELRINDRAFAMGVTGYQVEIPAFGTAIVPINLYSSVLDMLKNVVGMGLEKADKLNYKLAGNIRIEGGTMMPSSLPFESKGELSLSDLTRTPTNR
jgi:LEA14-like dessication related protein